VECCTTVSSTHLEEFLKASTWGRQCLTGILTSSERAKRLQHRKGTRLTTVISSLEFCISMLINLFFSRFTYRFTLFYTCGLTAVIKTNMNMNMVRYFFTARFYASAVLVVGMCLCVCLSVTGWDVGLGQHRYFLQPYLTIPYFFSFWSVVFWLYFGCILAVTTFMGQANLRNSHLIRWP